MKSSGIKIGETYLLDGKPFKVVSKEKVWRKLKKRRAFVYYFFDQDGNQASAEELDPTWVSEFQKEFTEDFIKRNWDYLNRRQFTGGAPASDYEVDNPGTPF